MRIRTRHAVLVALMVGGLGAAPAATTLAAAASDQLTARPQGATQYAEAVYDGWRAGDNASLVDLATPEVVQLLAARSADGEAWDGDMGSCEGAAGSVYCTATSPDVTLTLRVGNQLASAGSPHAVRSAWFTRQLGAAAMWPVTTTEEAWNTQAQVDAGHSPWMLDPEAVASAYAAAELGFAEPVVEAVSPTFFTLRVVDAATGVAVDVEANQPARAERGGIWAIAQVTSLPAATEAVPL